MTLTSGFSADGPDKAYAGFLQRGEFKLQHCANCQKHVFYPRICCPICGSNRLDWVEASGRGTVYSTSVPRGMQEEDYNISLITLAEGPRLLSRVVGVPPEAVAIDQAVTAFVGEIAGIPVVLFKASEPIL